MTRRTLNIYTWAVAVLAALAMAIAYLAVIAPADSASAMIKIKCKQTTGTAQIDPIISHNVDGPSSHMHAFFGNNGWLSKGNFANYDDLIGQPTNCDNAGDTAGYWQPILLDTRTGKQLPARTFTAYYRTYDSQEFGSGQMAYPPDTRLTAMEADALGAPGSDGWTCGQNAGVSPSATIPDCSNLSQKPGEVLTVHISFPSCWDGVLPNHHDSDVGNTSDDAHYAYPTRSGKGWACPAAFPHQMAQLRETLQYPNPDKVPAQYLAVSSDPVMGGHNGSSMHGDFWQTWDPQTFNDLVCQQVNQGKGCVNPPSGPSPSPTSTSPSPSPTSTSPSPSPTSTSPTPTPTTTTPDPTSTKEDHPWCDAHPGRCHGGHKHHHHH